MRTVSFRLADFQKAVIPLGFVGENEHTRVLIDAKKMFDEYPTAVASLTVLPPAGEAYPAVVTRDGDIVVWDIVDSDLIYDGTGEIQLSFSVNDVIAKSYICRIKINRSLVPTDYIPSPIDDWLTRANAALAEIPETIDEALQEAKDSGEFDGQDGAPGADGADGFSPTVSVTEITGGHQLTVTDAEGDHTFSVMDGADGAAGQDGQDGQDGFSPRATVTKSGSTATITITDATGTTTQTISDGATGPQGPQGPKGDTGEVSQAEFDDLAEDVSDLKKEITTLNGNWDDVLELLADVKEALENDDPDAAINLIDTFLIDHGHLA